MESVAAVADQPHLGVQSLEPCVGEPEPHGGEDPVAVAADRAGELRLALALGRF